ncbi:MAG: DUF2306 domain-containing protein [Lysobacter sp.]
MPPTFPATAAAPQASAPCVRDRAAIAGRLLRIVAIAWVAVAGVGQLFFAAYVSGFYGRTALHGRWQDWNKVYSHNYVAGDGPGNAVMIVHLAFAVFLIVGGLLQLSPAVRARWPPLHRWNGRIYVGAGALMSLSGLSLMALRGTPGDASQDLGIGINAALILIFGWQAVRHARARRFDLHRRWALRLYLAMAGVWFFRIGLSLWLMINQGPAGFDPQTFSGPFLTVLSFAQYLLPLAMLELYLRALARPNAAQRGAVAAALMVATLATAGGVVAASMILWLPRLH